MRSRFRVEGVRRPRLGGRVGFRVQDLELRVSGRSGLRGRLGDLVPYEAKSCSDQPNPEECRSNVGILRH